MRTRAELLLSYHMPTYIKQPLSLEHQLETLQSKGLNIEDFDFARQQLGKIGYFRLANYWRPMEEDKVNHKFKPYSRFSNAVDLYYFDKELRTLIFSAIQSVEVAFRARLMHEVAMSYGSFWLLDTGIFSNQQLAEVHILKIKNEVSRSKEDFITEYFQEYDSPELPPVWKTMEVITFGTVSKLYQNLADKSIKKKIARSFGLPQYRMMESWIKPLAGLRNFIAHHSRVWNRNFPQMPQLPPRLSAPWISTEGISHTKLYAQLCCLAYLQNAIHPQNDFSTKLHALLQQHPNVDLRAMGFPYDWHTQPLWR